MAVRQRGERVVHNSNSPFHHLYVYMVESVHKCKYISLRLIIISMDTEDISIYRMLHFKSNSNANSKDKPKLKVKPGR